MDPTSNCSHVISIHAPARGATHHKGVIVGIGVISIHAPARGATAKITYFYQNKDLYLGNTNNSRHYLIMFKHGRFHILLFFWCEPPYYFPSTCHSHQPILYLKTPTYDHYCPFVEHANVRPTNAFYIIKVPSAS